MRFHYSETRIGPKVKYAAKHRWTVFWLARRAEGRYLRKRMLDMA